MKMVDIPGVNSRTVAAHRALLETLDALQNPTRKPAAIQAVFETYTDAQTSTVEEQAVKAAQARILGEPAIQPDFEPATRLDVLLRAWMRWAAHEDVAEIFQQQPNFEFGGAVHSLVLDQFELALKALFVRDLPTSEKFWDRALQLGEQYGTDSHEVIQWLFAATFFRKD